MARHGVAGQGRARPGMAWPGTAHTAKRHRAIGDAHFPMRTTRGAANTNSNTSTPDAIALPRMNIRRINVTIVGDSPLITHAWSAAALKQIRDKQQKKARAAREAKDPQVEYEGAMYRTSDGAPGFPASGLKNCLVDAAPNVEGLKKTTLRGALHVDGDIIPIDGKPVRREDAVRVGMGGTDLRYRPEFKAWKIRLSIRFNASILTQEQLVHLLDVAGFSVGIGDWRPQRNGSFGMFHVERA